MLVFVGGGVIYTRGLVPPDGFMWKILTNPPKVPQGMLTGNGWNAAAVLGFVFFSIGGKFDVLDAQGMVICTLQGKWTSWDFRFMKGEKELANVSKKWAGLGKELFTSADNYMLTIDDSVAANDTARVLIMAAVLCIDMVLKE